MVFRWIPQRLSSKQNGVDFLTRIIVVYAGTGVGTVRTTTLVPSDPVSSRDRAPIPVLQPTDATVSVSCYVFTRFLI